MFEMVLKEQTLKGLGHVFQWHHQIFPIELNGFYKHPQR
jgi:hypothetical protein